MAQETQGGTEPQAAGISPATNSRRTNGHRSVLIEVLLNRDGPRCGICLDIFGLEDFIQIDHKEPKAKGGVDSLANYQLAHGRCNAAKGTGDSNRYEPGRMEYPSVDTQFVKTKRIRPEPVKTELNTRVYSGDSRKSNTARQLKWQAKHKDEFNRRRRERYAAQKGPLEGALK